MTGMRGRRVGPAVGAFVLLGGLAVSLSGGAAAQPGKAAGEVKADTPTQGAAICQGCHQQDDPTKNPEYKATRAFDFVRLQENQIWGSHDLHTKAFDNLSNALGKGMEVRLKAARGDRYAVTTDAACLACHASVADPSSPVADRTAASFLDAIVEDPKSKEPVTTKEGVGCEMCHGPGVGYLESHKKVGGLLKQLTGFKASRLVEWRDRPPAEKTKTGFVNLRDPRAAADRCASCHIGNLAEGKFVTHEMFAAGHPPLPPVDLVAYNRDQPRHWGLPRELPYLQYVADTDPKKAWDRFHYRAEAGPGGELYLARRFAETTVATLQAALVLLEQQLPPEGRDAEFDGLDFAAFDCAACHHDLKVPSDRQARGYDGPPGRPLFRPAQFALARVVAEHAATMPNGDELKDQLTGFDDEVKKLGRAFGDRTLGNPARLRAAARDLKARCDGLLAGLDAVRYTPDQTRHLMLAVAAAGRGPVADPEVAQLYAWAFETLRAELRDAAKGQDPPGWADASKELSGTVVTRLRNRLPAGEVRPADPLPPTNDESVAGRLADRMTRFNAFRADKFQGAFGKAAALYQK